MTGKSLFLIPSPNFASFLDFSLFNSPFSNDILTSATACTIVPPNILEYDSSACSTSAHILFDFLKFEVSTFYFFLLYIIFNVYFLLCSQMITETHERKYYYHQPALEKPDLGIPIEGAELLLSFRLVTSHFQNIIFAQILIYIK